MKSPIQFFAAIAILLATATVAAQVYKWVDKDGKVQYSDSPPPASATKTEAKKIETGPAAASIGNNPAPSLADRSKDFDKRQKEAAEKNKKAEEARKTADADEENCKSAKAALRDFESERPLRRSTDSGEVLIVTDEERQAGLAKARAAVTASCKA
ncbi:MAG: DUF4124 domain-containing protein [Betaproteobacteria bacterium]